MQNSLRNILFTVTLGLTSAWLSSSVMAAQIDPTTPEGSIQISRKVQCSLTDSKPETFTWQGRAYARVPGERDKLLFLLEGMNIRQCVSVEDAKRGTGYRLVSREIMLYLDPETGDVMKTFANPWTGESNEVIQVANDPVNQGPNFARDKDGNARVRPLKIINGTWFMPMEIPLFYTNPLGGDYQSHIGGTYHATEIFDFNGDADELLDANKATAYPVVSWVRIAQWLPWMDMGNRVGIMYFNAVGKKLESWDQLPALMKKEIADNYPEYTQAPPVDDDRPNETSWTFMKKIIDQREAEAAKSK